jgi:ketosteroid isomerase-like protein
MQSEFFIRPKIVAGSAFVLLILLFDLFGKRTGDEQAIRRLRMDFNRAISARDLGALPKFWREDIHITTGIGRQLSGKKPDGRMELRGTYLAMWRKENGQWLIQSELFVLLRCSGSKECAE